MGLRGRAVVSELVGRTLSSTLGHLPFLLRAQLLCLLGECFEDYSGEVCGAVVNIRAKGDKIALWTSEAEDRAGVMHIG